MGRNRLRTGLCRVPCLKDYVEKVYAGQLVNVVPNQGNRVQGHIVNLQLQSFSLPKANPQLS